MVRDNALNPAWLTLASRRSADMCFRFLPLFLLLATVSHAFAADFVIVITVDGLRSSVFSELTPAQIPNLTRLRAQGVFTDNARTDYDWTFTNPNHVSIITARQVEGVNGHGYTSTSAPPAGQTLHTVRGFYLTSIFDVAHDRGQRTGVFVTKATQFSIINASYTAITGAPDLTGVDHGRDKIDVYFANDYGSPAMVNSFLTAMATPFHLTWMHFADPDDAGHNFGWATTDYRNAVRNVDSQLGRILTLIDGNPFLRGLTTLIVTADHGGTGFSHTDKTLAANYTIPFIVWGADVPRPGDLYFVNRPSRRNPGTTRPTYAAIGQPIRNIDAGNLALMLLGLPAIPDAGALINRAQDLRVALPPFFITRLESDERGMWLSWPALGPGYGYRVEIAPDPRVTRWLPAPGVWPITGTDWFDTSRLPETRFYRVVATALP